MNRVALTGRPGEVWELLDRIDEDTIWAAVDHRYTGGLASRTVLARQINGRQPGLIAGVYLSSVERVVRA